MIDWFVLLTPFLLVPIVLLFSFVGCTAQLGGAVSPLPKVTMNFRYEIADIAEQPQVVFSWTIDEEAADPVPLMDPAPDPESAGVNLFRHAIEGARPGEWVVRCRFLTLAQDGTWQGWGEAICPFPVEGIKEYKVSFELGRLDDGGFEVRSSVGGCPDS
ncbi:MAG: hypothetical protein C3F12_07375 [Candidatus Methylomirabilota bacterium]|nr:hypothetical protein [Candidatus Methylomirabilis sp.]NJD67370.1 hypothetical protein [candidate division NC10 bacterium]PWB45889.1 MAG: hypothetical protein C3F12_07375 [candidate division NC10 bacterium]